MHARLPRLRAALRSLVRPPAIMAYGAGAAIALGQAPFDLWPVAFLGVIAAALLWARAEAPRSAAFLGWCIGTAHFLIALSWIVNPFLVEPWRHGWMIPFALFFMAGGLALFWSLAFFLAKILKTGLSGLAGFWGAAELARGHVLTGFPWAMPGYIWSDTPLAQLAAYVGPYGLTLLTFGLAALVAAAVVQRSLKIGTLAVGAFGLCVVGGVLRLTSPLPEDTAHKVRVVQPNAPQHQKWDPAYMPIFYDRALSLSPPEGADLVIWPETSVPALLYAASPYFEEISATIAPARAVVGLNRFDGTRGYNSAVVLDETGLVHDLYDKHHLVPFGEYIPLPGLLSRIGFSAFTAKEGYGYSAGPGPRVLDMGPLGQALPLICYEAIFPRDMRVEVRPDWLLQITNDAWFGSFSGPQQSLVQSRFRAIETGLPMVRAANTGISAVIDERGDIRAELPLNSAGAFTAQLPGAGSVTPYVRWGEWPVLVLLITLAFLGRWTARDRITD